MIYPLLAAELGLSVGCSGGVDRMAVAEPAIRLECDRC